MRTAREFLRPLLDLHDAIRHDVVAAAERAAGDALNAVAREEQADTIYAIDVVAEEVLDRFAAQLGTEEPLVLIAEGLAGGRRTYPRGTDEADAAWRVIVDPIDGTRGLMYQKRSGWILSAVAPNRGAATSLKDVVLAVQTEIPLRKQHLSDQLVALQGQPLAVSRYNRLTGASARIEVAPSRATTIAHGYATVSRFFPGGREQLAAIDDAVIEAALGPGEPGKALCFEDQYASTGGQLYELVAGHDRFIADLRGLVPSASLCCHPYDICTAPVATATGVILTDPFGRPLDVPLDTTTNVSWIGYANEHLRRQIEPHLQAALRSRGWI
jgi:hypothetical protein